MKIIATRIDHRLNVKLSRERQVWHNDWHSFLSIWVPVRWSLVCFCAKPTQRSCTRDFPRDRKKTREGNVPEQGSRQNSKVSRREQKTEVGGSRLEGPNDPEAGLANVRGWVSVPGDYFGFCSKTRLRYLTECYKRVTNFSLLAFGVKPSPCLFVLFSSTLSFV